MVIIEIVVLIIAWFITLSWMLGVRIKPIMPGTILGSLLILIFTTLITFSDYSSFHLIWLLPVGMFVVGTLGSVLFATPLIGNIIFFIIQIYASILRIGLSESKKEQMNKEFIQDNLNVVNELVDKHDGVK